MIKTLIIMTTYGQIFYSKDTFFGEETGETDISLTAGLISAVYNMTAETQQQKITELELEHDRSVFRELPGEKLFIITVDKRMDTADADDLLTALVNAFNKKYGEIQMDGLVLNDFEPVVDEIVAERLWYNTAEKKPSILDVIASIIVLGTFVWYPYWLLSGEDTIIKPLQDAFEKSTMNLIAYSLLIGLLTSFPLILSIVILKRYSQVSQTFRFAAEFLRRPTRGGYSESLPFWFLIFPFFSSAALVTAVRFGRGLQYGVTAQTFGRGLDNILVTNSGQSLFWNWVFTYLLFYLVTWYLILPAIVGGITQNLNWKFFKGSWVLIGMSMLVYIPAQVFAGVIYQESLGFHPQDQTLSGTEATLLPFFFQVLVPMNFFLFTFIFFLGIGMSQLITRKKPLYPIAFALALFAVLAVQQFLFFFIFNSDIFFDPLFR